MKKGLFFVKPLKISIIYLSLIVSGNFYAATNDSLFQRQAKGNLTEYGGATRLKGDTAKLIKKITSNKKAKNVILFIGDGMGDSEITIARNYYLGAGNYFPGIDALPFTAQYTHYSLNKKTLLPDYVTDSAASATAWSTGFKSYNGAIGVDVFGKPQDTLFEKVRKVGKSIGNVTTAEIQDATPAALYAHVKERSCKGPESTLSKCSSEIKKKEGLGSISEQLIDAPADVSLGGGEKYFKEVIDQNFNTSLLDEAQKKGFQIVKNLDELNAIKIADQKKPLLGLFADQNLPVRWQGPKAVENGSQLEAIHCTDNPERTKNIPNLADMTKKAIELLKDNPKGFFLQVEGASIDKEDHNANPCGQIGETVDLDEAVKVGLDFAKKHGDTLIIVTADHAHTSQIIPVSQKPEGLSRTLRTKDGSDMQIVYNNAEGNADQPHTGTQIRVAAYGPQAQIISGLLDQTDIHFIILKALGITTK